MAVIEVLTFRLAPDAPDDEFLDADRAVQTGFAYHRPGLLRRTTARGAGGDWLVVTVWGSPADAEAAGGAAGDDPAVARFTTLLEPASVVTRRYATLD